MKTLTRQERWIVFLLAVFLIGGAVIRCQRDAAREIEPPSNSEPSAPETTEPQPR